ncbi:MAG TPA: Glu-tRNA(Gln) amidotransferase subunit GatD [Candidatus Woesearchaeota archaeon]|nr:Glu-tRNA(Gln) amidotransferase subunit GatD [Candidatus Woesearchaeota archaeon]
MEKKLSKAYEKSFGDVKKKRENVRDKMVENSSSIESKGKSLTDNLSRNLWAFEFVKVYKKDKTVFEGRLVKDDKKEISLKLKSGYNIVILKENIESIEKISDTKHSGSELERDSKGFKVSKNQNDAIKKEGEEKKNNVGQIDTKKRFEVKMDSSYEKSEGQSNLSKVVILHTGGTIASKVDYDVGGVSAFFEPDEIVSLFPELKEIAKIETRKVSNVFSDELRFEDYNVMCENIVKTANEGCKGIIITHGTDTMHYTSAALSFMLKGLNIPVVIVGAQRSSDRSSSDSGVNLIAATRFAIEPGVKGVFICMHEKSCDDSCVILKGVNVRKMHSSRRDAFRQINSKPFARVKKNRDVEILDKDYLKEISKLERLYDLVKKGEKKDNASFDMINPDLKIAMVYVHPNMTAEEISYIKNFDGAILIGTGLGHIGTTKKNKVIFDEVKSAIDKGCVVAVCPQTIYGRINFNVYSNGVKLKEIGCLGNLCDITPETGFIKLAYLLSNYDKSEAKRLYEKNLRMEINSRIGYKEDFED